jgi:hypothetical protein
VSDPDADLTELFRDESAERLETLVVELDSALRDNDRSASGARLRTTADRV